MQIKWSYKGCGGSVRFFDTFSHGYGQSYFYYQGKRKPYWDLHSYQPYPVENGVYQYYRNVGCREELLFLSEIGAGSLPCFENVYEKFSDKKLPDAVFYQEAISSLDRVTKDLKIEKSWLIQTTQQLHSKGLARQIRALQANENCAGYSVTQLADAGNEMGAGLLNIWREDKINLREIRNAAQKVIASVRPRRNSFWTREDVIIDVELVNRTEGPLETQLTVQGRKETVILPVGTTVRTYRFRFDTPGRKCISSQIMNSKDETYVLVLDKPEFLGEIGVIDPEDSLTHYDFMNWKKIKRGDFFPENIIVGKITDPKTLLSVSDLIYMAQLNNEKGGNILYMEMPAASHGMTAPYFVKKQRFYPCFFNATGVIEKDSVLDGVDHVGFLDDTFSNLLPIEMVSAATINEFSGKRIITGIDSTLGQFVWGGILTRFKNQKGAVYFNTLRLAENLQEPVTQKLIFNMMR